MLLAVDVGNTSTIIGVWDADRLVARFRISTNRMRMVSEYRALLAQLLALEGLPVPTAAIVSSVVPPVEEELSEALSRSYDIDTLRVDAAATGLAVELPNPGEVGADRLVNAVAVLEYHDPRNRYILVDFGTAATFDLVEAPGRYLGGAIAPGPQAAADALALKTAKLPRIAMEAPLSGVVGRDTVQALQSGLVLGYASLVEGMVRRFKEAAGEAMVVATGGFAKTLEPLCQVFDRVDPNLTLKGLRLTYIRMTQDVG